MAGWLERTLALAIYYAFFEYPYLTAMAALAVASLIGWLIVRFIRNRRPMSDGKSATQSQKLLQRNPWGYRTY